MSNSKLNSLVLFFIIILNISYFTITISPNFFQKDPIKSSKQKIAEPENFPEREDHLNLNLFHYYIQNKSVFSEPKKIGKTIQKEISQSIQKPNLLKTSISSSTATPHDPIMIESNADFSGFPGTGTINDPFRIENFTITGFDATLISVSNTDVHFRMKNCVLDGVGTGTGISLFNTSNGVIENNIIRNVEGCGIYVENSSIITIDMNDVHHSVQNEGIFLWESNNILLSNNTIHNNELVGMVIYRSKNNSIFNNTIYDNKVYGISLSHSRNNSISNNAVSGNQNNGIDLDYSNENKVCNNDVSSNLAYGGIFLLESNKNVLENNNVSTNLNDGIFLVSSDENMIKNNTASFNHKHGIYIGDEEGPFDSVKNILINNLLFNNTENGIHVAGSYNIIARNNISFNGGRGIFLGSSDNNSTKNNLIEENSIHNNLGPQLFFWFSENNVIKDNYLFNITVCGIFFRYSENNTVFNNTISKVHDPNDYPSAAGITLQIQSQGGVKIFNNTISDLAFGITPRISNDNIICNNTIINAAIGIELKACINNTISNNHIYFEGDQEVYSTGIVCAGESKYNFIMNNTVSNHRGTGLQSIESSDNIFSFNSVFNNRIGIFLAMDSNNISLTHNIIINSTSYGIEIAEYTGNNTIKFNDFKDNNNGNIQATDFGFNNLFIFNFWSDWTSPDSNSDGFTDNPYFIASSEDNFDYYPLVNSNPPQSHLLLPPMILSPNGGESLTSTIIIQWDASIDSFDHPISYSIYLSKNDGETWSLITSNITGTTFEWNIKSSEYNGENCMIKVESSCFIHTVEDISDEVFTLNYPRENSDENLMRLLFIASISIILLGIIVLNYYYSKLKVPKSFTEYFQSNEIEFLKAIYNKVIIGLENTKTNIIPESVRIPITKPLETIEPLEPAKNTSLITYFPIEIHDILKSMRGRTALILIEMAYQDMRETNPTKISQSLNIPPTTVSDEIKKLIGLEFIEFYVKPSAIQDARFRYYNITSKGFSFLSSLKGALEISINRLKKKKQESREIS
ncbi:MAG: right-handed parallel beta-helix repeat-containing protein [Candidatus Hodarchaeales archaeon]